MSLLKDLSKAALTKTARLALEQGSRRARAWSGEAFNALDQLGGRVRDSAQASWQQTAPWRQRVLSGLAERLPGFEQTPPPAPAASEVEVEAPSRGVGDPAIAVQLFTKDSCPTCHRALRLLEDAKIDATVLAIDTPVNAYLAPLLSAETGQTTVPYVFIRGQFIGGYNELDKLQRLGELEARILAAPA